MRILIADDESLIRLGLKSMLQELGHEVVMAGNGREAIQLAQSHHPDLAILDIKMPYTDGLQAAKALDRLHPLPIILLTAYSDADLLDKATDLPIHGYLVKPVRPPDLAAAIAVAHKRFADTQALLARSAELAETLAARKLIEKAKGKIMAEMGLSEAEAYQAMQAEARRRQETLQAIATRILSRLP